MTRRAALPDWPRLMSEPMAAAYVSLSPNTLAEHGPKPVKLGRRKLYDRADLDRWADRLSGQPLDKPAKKAESRSVEQRFMEKRNAA